MRKGTIAALILLLSAIVYISFTAFDKLTDDRLSTQYAKLTWEEKSKIYSNALSEVLNDSAKNIKVIADINLKPPEGTDADDKQVINRRMIYSFDNAGEHYLVYAKVFWGDSTLDIEPLHSEKRSGETQDALVLSSKDWSEDEVFFGEIYNDDIIGVKVHIFVGYQLHDKPTYISENYELQNRGFIIEESIEKIWVRFSDKSLMQII